MELLQFLRFFFAYYLNWSLPYSSKIGREYWPYFTQENSEILRMWLANSKEPTKWQSQTQTFISTVFFLTLPCYFSLVITTYNIVMSLLFPKVCVKSFTCETFHPHYKPLQGGYIFVPLFIGYQDTDKVTYFPSRYIIN